LVAAEGRFGIIRECQGEAHRLLTEHRTQLDALANALIVQETLDEKQILEVTGLPPAPPLDTRKTPARQDSASI
jgi:cell division protease FtsH